MLKDECTVAIFDVDGTLVNGNCSRIFIDFLSAKNIITPSNISQYRHMIKKHDPGQEIHMRIAKEAFSILSSIDTELLIKSWEECFEKEVIPRMNRHMVEMIRSYQKQDKLVFLASGSPKILVKSIAEYLSISEIYIVASSIINSNVTASSNGIQQYCIGKGKEDAIASLFKKRKIDLKRACFYTDNLTDIPLLKQVGAGYWVGTDNDCDRYKLTDYGIKTVFNGKKESQPPRRISDKLNEYYRKHQDLIESAVTFIFPVTCHQKVLYEMIGKKYANWDLVTMQKSFFDPVNEYVSACDQRLLTIGACIFLEAGEVELNDYHALLGIAELLNISNEVFVDITNWASKYTQHLCNRSYLEISILGNASISLLSLPVHHIINDRIQLCPEVKLRIYEMYTSIVYKSLLGNGIRLYWKENDGYAVNFDEYASVSKLLNGGLFQFGIDLFQILKKTEYDQATKSAFSTFVQNASVLVQLLRDELSFRSWKEGTYIKRKYRFNRNTNLVGIHASKTSSYAHALSGVEDQQEVIDMISQTDSVEFLNGTIREYNEKVVSNIDALPFHDVYKKLIENYTYQLAHL